MHKWIPDRKVLVGGPVAVASWLVLNALAAAGVPLDSDAELVIAGLVGWAAQYVVPASAMDAARKGLDFLNAAIARVGGADA